MFTGSLLHAGYYGKHLCVWGEVEDWGQHDEGPGADTSRKLASGGGEVLVCGMRVAACKGVAAILSL